MCLVRARMCPHAHMPCRSPAVLFAFRAAVFERLSHFKDHGIPGTNGTTMIDRFNRAAIADGSCRMVGVDGDSGMFFEHPNRSAAVIAALGALPDTGEPSLFTRAAAVRHPLRPDSRHFRRLRSRAPATFAASIPARACV